MHIHTNIYMYVNPEDILILIIPIPQYKFLAFPWSILGSLLHEWERPAPGIIICCISHRQHFPNSCATAPGITY